MNLLIRQFQQNLINNINESLLPIEVKRLVLEDILTQTKAECNKVLQQELAEQSEEKESENNGN